MLHKQKNCVKYMSLVFLSMQTTVNLLMLRYVRTRKGDMFIDSTAVVMAEAVKTVIALVMILYEEGFSKWLRSLYVNIVLQPVDCIKVSVPSLIYVLQNNLLYVAVSNLDVATFQVYYQLKILTTALFSVVMLRRTLSKIQWLALVLLCLGVSIVQLQSGKIETKVAQKDQRPVLGIFAVFMSCLMSGFAGVYFEKILKGTPASIWVRNVQLGTVGMVIGLVTMEIKDGVKISQMGFFFGYDRLVWAVIILQTVGGLTVAVVVKYADNILKGFASSIAIITSSIASIYIFDFVITIYFTFGATIVIASVLLYSKFPHQPTVLPLASDSRSHQNTV